MLIDEKELGFYFNPQLFFPFKICRSGIRLCPRMPLLDRQLLSDGTIPAKAKTTPITIVERIATLLEGVQIFPFPRQVASGTCGFRNRQLPRLERANNHLPFVLRQPSFRRYLVLGHEILLSPDQEPAWLSFEIGPSLSTVALRISR